MVMEKFLNKAEIELDKFTEDLIVVMETFARKGLVEEMTVYKELLCNGFERIQEKLRSLDLRPVEHTDDDLPS